MILTDHKPLISLFNETKPVPQMVSPRVQCWSVWLRTYEYCIISRPGKQNINADALSRLPLPETCPLEEEEDLVLILNGMDTAPVTTEQERKWTAKDATLSRVEPYFTRRYELSIRDGCVL